MTGKLYYCEKCEDLVPETEVKNPFPTLKGSKVIHYYTETRNYYGNLPPGRIAYCPVSHPVFCGNVREPTPEEYFIHFTCNPERNKSDVETGPERKAASPRGRTTSNRRKVGARKGRA